MSFRTPVVSGHIEEVLVPKESIPIPFAHTETAGSIEDVGMVEHPPIVLERSDVYTINDSANVQLQPEETSEARLTVQEGDETVQLPCPEFSDIRNGRRSLYK